MKLSSLLGERYREKPAECSIDSHIFMVRGGYIKQVTAGVYSLYTPARRIIQKIERILREEMDGLDGQEVLFPVTMPASLWERSGRYDSIDNNLLRFQDRSGAPMLLGMTHEEAAVDLASQGAHSYAQFPFMIYQIQTKFRDELRSRAGLIRVREFTMKDAYSFHITTEDLQQYYQRCYEAYHRIFARCGLRDVIAVESDSGMMGGKNAHEFMLLTEVGEDSLAICPGCDFRSNVEAAQCLVSQTPSTETQMEHHTPGLTSIEEVCRFLGREPRQSAKAVLYQTDAENHILVVFLRGDLDVNEVKLRNYIGEDFHPAADLDDPRLTPGYIGPLGLDSSLRVIFDNSLNGAGALMVGGNRPDTHLTGVDFVRDCGVTDFVDIAKALAGGICPSCGKEGLEMKRGIEIGHIFQLGDKYTRTMNMRYTDADGGEKHPLMSCYGIGLGRLAASVCEANHDEYGPIWPMSIAPWHLQICALRADIPEVRDCADALYAAMKQRGVETLYDDRNLSAGVTFADADLLGIPLRVVVSPRNLKNGELELSSRDKTRKMSIKAENAAEEIVNMLREMEGNG